MRHHLDVLVQAGLVVAEGPRYGQLYYLTKEMAESLEKARAMLRGDYRWR
ncbi:transcriptional regulator [Acidilobus sp.]